MQAAALVALKRPRLRPGARVRPLGHFLQRLRLLPAAVGEEGVFGDAAEPGFYAALAAKAVHGLHRLEKGLLRQLLGLVFVTGQGQRIAVHRVKVGPVDPLEVFFRHPLTSSAP